MGNVALAVSFALTLAVWLFGAFAALKLVFAVRRHDRWRELTRSEQRTLAMRIFLLEAADPETAGLRTSYRMFLISFLAFFGCVVLLMVVAATT